MLLSRVGSWVRRLSRRVTLLARNSSIEGRSRRPVRDSSGQAVGRGEVVVATLLPDGTRDTGVRVLLVTEIANLGAVGSGDEAALRLVEQHDRTIRGLLARYGGREVRHTGDGMMLSFHLPSAAVQRWQVRRLSQAVDPAITLRIE